jgi:hypothetical protein
VQVSEKVLRALGGNADRAPSAAIEFVHEREPKAEWVEQLREVSVLTDQHGQLELVWEPGDPWVPLQRFTLWETLHISQVDPDEVEALRGPNPRGEGHMCTRIKVPGQFVCECKVKLEGWRGSANPGVNFTQWKLFQRTGRVGRQFWIIEGDRGGHKWHLTEEEKKILCAAGRDPNALPAPGSLPYAEFDARVMHHITRFNRLRQLSISLAQYKRRMGPHYALHRAEVERDIRKRFVAWMDEQMQPEYELFVDAAKKGEMDDGPKSNVAWDAIGEQAMQQYVETGVLPHPSQLK